MADGRREAVRGLHLAHPELGPKPLLAKLREQQPDLAAGNNEASSSRPDGGKNRIFVRADPSVPNTSGLHS